MMVLHCQMRDLKFVVLKTAALINTDIHTLEHLTGMFNKKRLLQLKSHLLVEDCGLSSSFI